MCHIHVMTGHNFEILMNDPVDELVGATEQVGTLYPCSPMLMVPRPKDLQLYNTITSNGTRYLCPGYAMFVVSYSYDADQSNKGLLNCIRALGGYTTNTSAKTIYTTNTFDEDQYMGSIPEDGGSLIGLTS